MAGNISNYLETKLLEHSLGKTAFTLPTNVYAALYTVAPTDAGGGTEVTVANGYARVVTSWNSAVNGAITNAADIRFPSASTATGTWGTVVALGLFDASTNGNLLWYGPLSASVTINNGDDFRIAAGGLTITLD
jgi:hypothetical protein